MTSNPNNKEPLFSPTFQIEEKSAFIFWIRGQMGGLLPF